MDVNTLVEIVKGNGIAGVMIVVVFLWLKFNDFAHVNKTLERLESFLNKQENQRQDGHNEITEGFHNLEVTLTRMEQYLKDRLNGNNNK